MLHQLPHAKRQKTGGACRAHCHTRPALFVISQPDIALNLSEAVRQSLSDIAGSFQLKREPVYGMPVASLEYDGTTALEILRDQRGSTIPQVPLGLPQVLTAFEALLEAWEKRRRDRDLKQTLQWPVLVIDEANKLEAWQQNHVDDLDALISFLIRITKEANLCHVFLVTSECGFEEWLQQPMQAVAQQPRPAVLRATRGGDGWTCAQFAHAALALLDSTHNAVTQDTMELLLGGHDATAVQLGRKAQEAAGEQALRALVKAHRLGLRPYSEWALDIPREAYGLGAPVDVVTASTPADLYCMRVMHSELQRTLDEWKQRQQQGHT
ncbi:hypothetical protein JKP88DRAFT_335933 [Tribonema minus]|uniref:Uncharacterized protein n=1 Tax=Tribonema minus TaxID=303371 RepID=A0A835YMF2_9STRA|nr:hypothetical protein JKP88DRAFT_335933 [Tribonema minus]